MSKSIHQKIKEYCFAKNLSQKVEKKMQKFARDSYIQGSNEVDEIIRRNYKLIPKED